MKLPLKVRVLNLFRRLFQHPALERVLSTLTRGRLSNHLVCKLVPNSYQYKKPTFRTIDLDGVLMKVDLSDYIGHYCFFGFRDPALQTLFSMCKVHFNVLDIGTNVGFTVLKLANAAWRGKVIGFEPDPTTFSHCSHNLSLNKGTNATIMNLALGSSDAELWLEVRSPGNLGGNRIIPAAEERNGVARVPVRRLDSIFADLGMERLDLVKIDVEGYELQTLKGAEKTLRKFNPILFIEVDENNLLDQGDSAQKLIGFILDLGYGSIVRADNGKSIGPDFDFRNCHFDIIVK